MTIDEKIIVSLNRAFSRNSNRVPDGVKDFEWRYALRCAADTVAWVLSTGRFSGSQVFALHNCRMYDLLRHLTITAMQTEEITQDHIYKILRNYKPFLKHWHQHIGH